MTHLFWGKMLDLFFLYQAERCSLYFKANTLPIRPLAFMIVHEIFLNQLFLLMLIFLLNWREISMWKQSN